MSSGDACCGREGREEEEEEGRGEPCESRRGRTELSLPSPLPPLFLHRITVKLTARKQGERKREVVGETRARRETEEAYILGDVEDGVKVLGLLGAAGAVGGSHGGSRGRRSAVARKINLLLLAAGLPQDFCFVSALSDVRFSSCSSSSSTSLRERGRGNDARRDSSLSLPLALLHPSRSHRVLYYCFLYMPQSRALTNSSSENPSIFAASMCIFCRLRTSISFICFLNALISSVFCGDTSVRRREREGKGGGGGGELVRTTRSALLLILASFALMYLFLQLLVLRLDALRLASQGAVCFLGLSLRFLRRSRGKREEDGCCRQARICLLYPYHPLPCPPLTCS